MNIERMPHPRIHVNWPVVILTPEGAIIGESRNISVGGALIQCSEGADLNGELHNILSSNIPNSGPYKSSIYKESVLSFTEDTKVQSYLCAELACCHAS